MGTRAASPSRPGRLPSVLMGRRAQDHVSGGRADVEEKGEARLGFVTMGIALQAWNGTGAWEGKKPTGWAAPKIARTDRPALAAAYSERR